LQHPGRVDDDDLSIRRDLPLIAIHPGAFIGELPFFAMDNPGVLLIIASEIINTVSGRKVVVQFITYHSLLITPSSCQIEELHRALSDLASVSNSGVPICKPSRGCDCYRRFLPRSS
jgi:hypothetical protein